MSAISPPGTGIVDITVTTPNGTSATSQADKFTYQAAPSITSISPTLGPTTGGTTVTITGTGFTGATSVDFGSVAATSFSVVSDTQVSAISPPGTGSVDVTVTTPNGTSATSQADKFTYQAAPSITSISPTSGPTTGGTTVTITGTGFTGATSVAFGSVAASSFSVVSDTQISAISPPGTGTVAITVTTTIGTSLAGIAEQFTYLPVPTITSISPNSGPISGGTMVIILGTEFTGATAVYFASKAGTGLTIVSSTQMTITSPAELPGTVDVTISTPNGTSPTSSADKFTYEAPQGGWQSLPPPLQPGARLLSAMGYDPATHDVVLFGGATANSAGSFSILDDTWLWNGMSWVEASPSVEPPARAYASIAYDANLREMILFGGISLVKGGGYTFLNDTWAWNGANWTELSPLNSPPSRAGASLIFDSSTGNLVLFGGLKQTGGLPGAYNDTWLFRKGNWTQQLTPSSPPARSGGAMVYDNQTNAAVLFGGMSSSFTALGDTWVYNGSSWQLQLPTTSPPARIGAQASFDSSLNRLVLFGGTSSFLSVSPLSDTWTYDPTNDMWTQVSPPLQPALALRLASQTENMSSPQALAGGSLVFDPATKQSILFGGFAGSYGDFVAGLIASLYRNAPGSPKLANEMALDTWAFNGSWSQEDVTPIARQEAAMTTIRTANESIQSTSPDGSSGNRSLIEFQQSHNRNKGRQGLSDHEVLLFGGRSTSGEALGDTWIFNGLSWSAISNPGGPTPRYGAAIASYPVNGGALLFGGISQTNTALNDTWVFNSQSQTWIQMHPSQSPPARYGATLARGPNGELVLFGGENNAGTVLSDTWVWDGTDWHQAHPPQSPPARFEAVSAGLLGNQLTFPGESGSANPIPSTSDPTSHSSHFNSSLRKSHSEAQGSVLRTFDHRNSTDVILFGGRSSSGALLDDTWSWNGVAWKQLSPENSPPASYNSAVASLIGLSHKNGAEDQSSNLVAIVGGTGISGSTLSGLWMFNGKTWQESSQSLPSASTGSSLAFLRNLNELLLFGGSQDGTLFGVTSQTWLIDLGSSCPASNSRKHSDASNKEGQKC